MHLPFYLFAPLFVVMAIGIMFVLSRLGWIHLSRKYGTKEKFDGIRIGPLIGRINGIPYKNVAILYCNKTELYFNSSILFRLFHAPFKIPIERFRITVSKNLIGRKQYYLFFNDVSDIDMKLDRKQGERLIAFLEKNNLEKLISNEK